MPKICRNCKQPFPFCVRLNGEIKNLGSRKNCLTCLPWKSGQLRESNGQVSKRFFNYKWKNGKTLDENCKEIQSLIDAGSLYKEIVKRFEISIGTLSKIVKSGMIKFLSESEKREKGIPRKAHPPFTEEVKKRISEARKSYLAANPDKVPYKLNHSSKESYPEKYFAEVFANENVVLTREHHVSTYHLDFCDIASKLAVEIDGSQHRVDPRIVQHDIKRTAILESLGWTIKRIYWPDFQKLSKPEKISFVRTFVDEVKNHIGPLS
jgi:very-short-patch-repair endonuclease